MNNSPLIIDIRQQLPWHKRYLTVTMTALLWAVWLLLWRPIMLVLGFIGVQNHHLGHHLMMLFLTAVEKGIILLIVCALGLLLWNHFVPFKSFRHAVPKTDDDYARYFDLNVDQLQHNRQQKISTVHHDDMGKIIHID